MQEGVMEQIAVDQEPEMISQELEIPSQEPAKSSPPVKKRKRRKKAPIIVGIVVLLLVGVLIWWLVSQNNNEPEAQVLTDVVQRGSITSVIKGSGVTKAKNSEAITLGTSGTVQDVYVSEGEFVAAGTLLYTITSSAADEAMTKAQKDIDGYSKQLKTLYEAKQNLNIKSEFAGKILDKAELNVGDYVNSGQVLARLVDDGKMKLTQYYSYAYESSIYVGQPAQVSVPSAMQTLSGTVTEITKVERISPEGSKLFSAVITVDNPGTLAEKLSASAVITANGEQISPYEQGALEFNRDVEIKSKVTGEVASTKLQDYLKVSSGEVLVRIDGEDNENEIFTLEENLREARKALEEAKENKEKLRATAPVDGTVVGLNLTVGEEVAANTTVISIVDTSQIVVEASIDERNVSYVTPGMMVEIDQWGHITHGTVESLSLTGKFENGMSTFPATIIVDNVDGMLSNGSSIVYTINASESDDCLILPTQCVKSVAHPETGESIDVVFVQSDVPPENSIEVDGSSLGVPEKGYYAVPVTIGISDTYNVEILGGVEEGAAVFTQVIRENSWG